MATFSSRSFLTSGSVMATSSSVSDSVEVELWLSEVGEAGRAVGTVK